MLHWSQVGAFVHLYHVWGVFCLLTAVWFGWPGVKRWKASGGDYLSLPEIFIRSLVRGFYFICKDWFTFWRWAISGAYRRKWPDLFDQWDVEEAGRAPAPLTLFFGISLGGFGGFSTALYWAERNRAWMTEETVLWPGLFVFLTVASHSLHQFTAFPHRPWIPRMILSIGLAWIILGGLTRGLAPS